MEFKRDRRTVGRSIHETNAVILAGGRGKRLQQLTTKRSKPAVPFGGKFRIIDFALSNCINSGIRKISIPTQYKAHSLIRHIERGWSFCRHEFGEFIELLPAQQLVETSWYLGTADAVYQNLEIIKAHNPSYVLILAGDHIYKMDFGVMIARHLEKAADVTIGCVEVPIDQAHAYGVMSVDEDFRITAFSEKPAQPDPLPDREDVALVSMGIYLFRTDFLCQLLEEDASNSASNHDFGHDIIPKLIDKHYVQSCQFHDMEVSSQAYWRDVGTVDAYWEANMELLEVTPQLNMYDNQWPILTYQEQLPPAKFVFDDEDRRGMAVDSLVSGGCILSGGVARHSLLSNNVRINSHSEVTDSVLLPNVEVGRNCRIRKAVIDNDCYIPENTVIGFDLEEDSKKFEVTSGGVVLVSAEMLGQTAHLMN